LEALRLATTKLTQQRTGYPFWGLPTQLRISRGSAGLRATVTLETERAKWPNPGSLWWLWNVFFVSISPLSTQARRTHNIKEIKVLLIYIS
jgi:hypothetical protein